MNFDFSLLHYCTEILPVIGLASLGILYLIMRAEVTR